MPLVHFHDRGHVQALQQLWPFFFSLSRVPCPRAHAERLREQLTRPDTMTVKYLAMGLDVMFFQAAPFHYGLSINRRVSDSKCDRR